VLFHKSIYNLLFIIYYLYGNITKSILIDSSQLQYTITVTGLTNETTYTCSVSYLCGDLTTASNPHNGGGEGGIYYDTSFNVSNALIYTISVGSKGIGAPRPLLNNTNNGTTGGDSSVTWSTNIIKSIGGIGSDDGNGTNQNQTTATYNFVSNAQCFQGGYWGNANGSVGPPNTWTSGSASELISVYLPFISPSTTIYVSGGGGGGVGTIHPAVVTVPAVQTWPHFYGGNGGDGVVIVWWANL
jgi:hypothetical protein